MCAKDLSCPEASVCVTFFNQDEYIVPTIKSLISLCEGSSHSWEIVVGLDRPSLYAVNSLNEICEINSNVRKVELKSDEDNIPLSRASTNRVSLLSLAKGEFVLILDGDDEYISLPDDGIALLHRNQKLVGCAYGHLIVDESKKTKVPFSSPYRDGDVITFDKHVSNDHYIHSNCILFRRKRVLPALLENKLYCNDTTLTKFLLSSGDIVYIDRHLMKYRVGINSIYSGASLFCKLFSQLIVQEENLKLFPEIKWITRRKIVKIIKRVVLRIRVSDVVDGYGLQIKKRNLQISNSALSFCSQKFGLKKIYLLCRLVGKLVF